MQQLELFLESVIEFLQRRAGVFLVLVAALAVQIPHPAEVFHRLATSQWPGVALFAHAALFAVVVELAVLIFVVRGRTKLSWAFAMFSISMNVFYYYTPAWLSDLSAVWPSVLQCATVSALLPLAIAFYSHETAKHVESPPEQPPVQKVKRTVRTMRTDEQSAEYTVVQPVQIPELSAEQVDWSVATAEQKRAFVAELLNSGAPMNKTELVRQLSIGRTTLYGWIKELQTV